MITQIAAIDLDGGIGKDGGIPWRAPADLRRFQQFTLGHPVIMGRATWDSLPKKFRPLPGRENIVVSRTLGTSDGCTVVPDLEYAVMHAKLASTDGNIFIIGGGEIYRQTLAATDRLLLTVVQGRYGCDTCFPEDLLRDWRIYQDGTPSSIAAREGQPGLVFLRLVPCAGVTDLANDELPIARCLKDAAAFAERLYHSWP